MTFSKKNYSTPLHSTHSTELFKIFFSLLTLSTAFLQKASGPGKNPSVILRKENIVKHGKYKIHLTKNMFNKLIEEKQLKYVLLIRGKNIIQSKLETD